MANESIEKPRLGEKQDKCRLSEIIDLWFALQGKRWQIRNGCLHTVAVTAFVYFILLTYEYGYAADVGLSYEFIQLDMKRNYVAIND